MLYSVIFLGSTQDSHWGVKIYHKKNYDIPYKKQQAQLNAHWFKVIEWAKTKSAARLAKTVRTPK